MNFEAVASFSDNMKIRVGLCLEISAAGVVARNLDSITSSIKSPRWSVVSLNVPLPVVNASWNKGEDDSFSDPRS